MGIKSSLLVLLSCFVVVLFAVSGCLHGAGDTSSDDDIDDDTDDDIDDDVDDDSGDDDIAEECDRGPTEVGACAAVIYEDDVSAEAWKNFLYFNQVGVARVHKDLVESYDFDTAFGGEPVTILIIEPHTTWSGTEGTDAEIAELLDGLGIPILALGQGGLAFLGFTAAADAGLNESSLVVEDADGFYVLEPDDTIFDAPVNIEIPPDGFLHILDHATDVVFVQYDSVPGDVDVLGALEDGSNLYNPVRYERYFFFGFEQDPETDSVKADDDSDDDIEPEPGYNEDGNHLLWNIVHFLTELIG